MGERARSFSRELAHVFDITVAYRHDDKRRAIREFLAALDGFRPHVSYVFDLAYSGVFAAALHRARAGCPWVVETGDAIYALAKSAGLRGPLGTLFTGALEQFGLRAASAVVVRGTEHRTLLSRYGIDATVVQDGVAPVLGGKGRTLGHGWRHPVGARHDTPGAARTAPPTPARIA